MQSAMERIVSLFPRRSGAPSPVFSQVPATSFGQLASFRGTRPLQFGVAA